MGVSLMPGEGALKSQVDLRQTVAWNDQHGRKWWAITEKATGEPVGRVKASFAAPWVPDGQYVRVEGMVEDADGRIRMACHIDYERMLADFREAEAAWDKAVRERMAARYKTAYDPAAPIDEDILEYAGPRPASSVLVQAAAAGNPWLLGLTDTVDVRLKRLVDAAAALKRKTRAPAPVAATEDWGTVVADGAEDAYIGADEAPAPAPKRRGRPPKNPVDEEGTAV